MATPTNERSEVLTNEVRNIPERDEELEIAIQSVIEKMHVVGTYAELKEYGGCTERNRVESVREYLREVASFSDRRATKDVEDRIKTAEVNAREKAIGECSKTLKELGYPHTCQAKSAELEWDAAVQKLKSQPQ